MISSGATTKRVVSAPRVDSSVIGRAPWVPADPAMAFAIIKVCNLRRKLNPSSISPLIFARPWTSNSDVRREDARQSGFIPAFVFARGPREQEMSPNQWSRMKLAKKLESKWKWCNAHPCGECGWIFHPCPQHWLVPGMHTSKHPYIHLSMHAPIHPCLYAYMPVCIHAWMPTACMRANTDTVTYAFTYTNTYTYTLTCTYKTFSSTCIYI